jgi:hypothetical protein
MSKLSRRSLVVSAASLPALAAPPGKVEIGPDAELMALGQKLQSLRADFLAELGKDAAENKMLDVESERITGIRRAAAPKDPTTRTGSGAANSSTGFVVIRTCTAGRA